MKITKEKIKDFSVLKMEGRFDSTNSPVFEEEIEKLYSSGEKNIILNFSGLDYVSSAGLRVFLIAQKRALSSHGKLHMCNMQPTIKETITVIGFSNMFSIFDTQEEALGH